MFESMKLLSDTFLMLLLLGSGFGSYALLSAFVDLPQAANLAIAMGLRTASIIFYRFYASRGTPMQLLFEWFIPVTVIAELIFAICVYPAIDALCVWSTSWAYIIVILFGLDIFTFLFLIILLDSGTSLGPYGAFHTSIMEGCTTLNTILSRPVETTPSESQSAQSQLTSFITQGRTPAPDPSIPLTPVTSAPVIDSVSNESAENQYPPPYNTYDSHTNYWPSKYSKYRPILAETV